MTQLNLTGDQLHELAARMLWLDFDTLADAGVLTRRPDGKPSKGGSDWTRFNADPLVFIAKLPTDRRNKLAALLNRKD
jgi:hypothetical protein